MKSYVGKEIGFVISVMFMTLFITMQANAAGFVKEETGSLAFDMPDFNVHKMYIYNTTYDFYVPSRTGHDALLQWGERDGQDYISRISKLNGAEISNYAIDTDNENINLRKLYDNNGSVIFMNLTFEPASLLIDYPLWVGKTWVRDIGGISGLLWIGFPVNIEGSTWGTGSVTHEEEISVPAGTVDSMVYETNMNSSIKLFGKYIPYNTSQKVWLMENGFFAKRQLFHEGIFKEELVLKEPIITEVNFKPSIINQESDGKFAAFIKVPEPYNASDIDIGTIECDGVSAVKAYVEEDKVIAKFNRADLNHMLSGKDSVLLTINGKLRNGKAFEGFDRIRTIEKNN